MLHQPRWSRSLAAVLLLACSLAVPARATLSTGSVTEVKPLSTDCPDPKPPVPPGGQILCGQISVSCPGAQPLNATVWVALLGPQTTLKGTIFLHNGGGGTTNFTSVGSDRVTLEANYEQAISQPPAGFQLVDIAWADNWEQTDAPAPNLLVAACRPATVARWVFQHPQIQNSRRDIGFCGQGHSAGSAAMGYMLAEYGLGDIFDFVMLTAGPVFSRIDCGCDTQAPGCAMTQLCPELPLSTMQASLGYSPGAQQNGLDQVTGTTTCGQNTGVNPGDATWKAQSVVTAAGAVLSYPQTGVGAWYCVNPDSLNTSAPEGSYFVHAVSQLGHPPAVSCTMDCTGEEVFNGVYNNVRITTLMMQEMTAGCVPRH